MTERLSIAAMARALGLPTTSLSYYIQNYGDYLPHTGEGRSRRYKPEALKIVKAIIEAAKNGHSREEIIAMLASYPRFIDVDEKGMLIDQQKPWPTNERRTNDELLLTIGTAIRGALEAHAQIQAETMITGFKEIVSLLTDRLPSPLPLPFTENEKEPIDFEHILTENSALETACSTLEAETTGLWEALRMERQRSRELEKEVRSLRNLLDQVATERIQLVNANSTLCEERTQLCQSLEKVKEEMTLLLKSKDGVMQKLQGEMGRLEIDRDRLSRELAKAQEEINQARQEAETAKAARRETLAQLAVAKHSTVSNGEEIGGKLVPPEREPGKQRILCIGPDLQTVWVQLPNETIPSNRSMIAKRQASGISKPAGWTTVAID